jgi:hypothetical protein
MDLGAYHGFGSIPWIWEHTMDLGAYEGGIFT